MNRYILISIASIWGGLVFSAPLRAEAPFLRIATPSSSEDNVFFPAEEKSVKVVAFNSSKTPITAKIFVKVKTDQGKLQELAKDIEVPAGGQVEADFKPDLPEPCFATLKAVCFNENGDVLASSETSLAVVRPPALQDVLFEKAFFGFSFFGNPETAKKIGGRFIRSMIHWKFSNPAPGKFNFGEFIDQGARAQRAGVGMIYTFALYHHPDWLKTNNTAELGSEDGFRLFDDWIAAALKQLPKGPFAIEVSNEPDLEFGGSKTLNRRESAKVASSFLEHGYKTVKAADPKIPVLGAGVSGVDFHNNLSFARQMLEDCAGSIDYFSPHPYTDARFINAEGSADWPDSYPLDSYLQKCADMATQFTKGKAVWCTELGWAISNEAPADSPLSRDFAAICGQAMVLFKTVPHVEKFAYFAGQVVWLENRCTYSLFGADDKDVGKTHKWHPLAPVNAFATVSSLLEGSETGQLLDLGPAVKSYRFENSATGQTVIALWASSYEVSLRGSLPKQLKQIDLYGREFDGASALNLTRTPTFLSIPSSEGERLVKSLAKAEWKPKVPFQITHISAEKLGVWKISTQCLLQKPATAEISFAGSTTKFTFSAGANQSMISAPVEVPRNGKLEIPVSIDSSAGHTEYRFSKAFCLVPYVNRDDLLIDGKISASEATLLNGTLNDRLSVLPPDPAIHWDGPNDLSVRYGYAWNEEGLYLAVNATDDVLAAKPEGGNYFWNYDSLQAGFDIGAESSNNYKPGDREIGIALNKSGNAEIFQIYPPKTDPPSIQAAVKRENTTTIYELFVPWSYFRIPEGQSMENAIIAANFIINDNDGAGRKYWMGPADGIASGKRPASFPWLVLAPKKTPIHP